MVSYEEMLQVVMKYTEAFIQEIADRIIAFSGHFDHCHCFVASTPVSVWPVDIFITYVKYNLGSFSAIEYAYTCNDRGRSATFLRL